VRQVVDHAKAMPCRVARRRVLVLGQELEVDVVDALAVLVAVDQVQRRAADALDRRQPQLHRPGRDVHRLRATLDRQRIGLVRVAHAKRQAAGAGPVLGGEIGGQAARLAVDDEVAVALAVQQHVLAAVAGDEGEAHLLEQRLQHAGRRRRELDELEAHQAHGVLEQVRHGVSPGFGGGGALQAKSATVGKRRRNVFAPIGRVSHHRCKNLAYSTTIRR
jgi:hypothetical protein